MAGDSVSGISDSQLTPPSVSTRFDERAPSSSVTRYDTDRDVKVKLREQLNYTTVTDLGSFLHRFEWNFMAIKMVAEPGTEFAWRFSFVTLPLEERANRPDAR